MSCKIIIESVITVIIEGNDANIFSILFLFELFSFFQWIESSSPINGQVIARVKQVKFVCTFILFFWLIDWYVPEHGSVFISNWLAMLASSNLAKNYVILRICVFMWLKNIFLTWTFLNAYSDISIALQRYSVLLLIFFIICIGKRIGLPWDSRSSKWCMENMAFGIISHTFFLWNVVKGHIFNRESDGGGV